MSIVSYAQNFEDVMLWRALGDLPQGFYIDIGAQDPVVDSVSKAFHDRGWRGVHVEPATGYAERLRQERPGDEVRQVAIGRRRGELTLYEVENSGLSTGDPDIASAYRNEGKEVHETVVDMITLDDLFESLDDQTVHWLKIDVEGMEKDVIAGWESSQVRPWLVVVESTRPGSRQESHQAWEPDLLAKSYIPVYFDGINRFYLASEHSELRSAFEAPPNVFDQFVLSGTASQSFCHHVKHQTWLAEEKAAEHARKAYEANVRLASLESEFAEAQKQAARVPLLEQEVAMFEQETESLSRRLSETETRYQRTNSQLQAVYQSRSWRLTLPVRKLITLTRHYQLGPRALRNRLQRLNNLIIYAAVCWVRASPRLRHLALRLLGACPPLSNLIRVRFHHSVMARNGTFSEDSPSSEAILLSPRQQCLKHQLETAISCHRQQE